MSRATTGAAATGRKSGSGSESVRVWIQSARRVNRKRAKEPQSDRAGRGITLGRAECPTRPAAWYFGESARARAGRRTTWAGCGKQEGKATQKGKEA